MDKKEKTQRTPEERLKDGNTCIGLGVGMGAVGAGAGIIAGATCPLCYVVVPALVGMGLIERRNAKKEKSAEEDSSD